MFISTFPVNPLSFYSPYRYLHKHHHTITTSHYRTITPSHHHTITPSHHQAHTLSIATGGWCGNCAAQRVIVKVAQDSLRNSELGSAAVENAVWVPVTATGKLVPANVGVAAASNSGEEPLAAVGTTLRTVGRLYGDLPILWNVAAGPKTGKTLWNGSRPECAALCLPHPIEYVLAPPCRARVRARLLEVYIYVYVYVNVDVCAEKLLFSSVHEAVLACVCVGVNAATCIMAAASRTSRQNGTIPEGVSSASPSTATARTLLHGTRLGSSKKPVFMLDARCA
jgi:hypothetical protein